MLGESDRQSGRESGRRLLIPYGRRVDYHLLLEPGTVLRADQLASSAGAGRLEIRLASDEGGERLIAELSGRQYDLEYPLTGARQLAARLSLIAQQEEERPGGGGVVLTAPAIWKPASTDKLRPRIEKRPEGHPQPQQTPNIIIYLVDTLRPDRLGAYGYDRPTSPHLDRFAEHAYLFEYTVGQAPWTRPSVASIFTGMTPTGHGTTGRKEKLHEQIPTLTEILSHSGYATAAVFSNPNVSANFGFDRGFDKVAKAQPSANDATRQAIAWLEELDGDRPLLLYIHTSEPHQPYLPSEPYRQQLAPDTQEIVEIFERNPRRQIWKPTASNLRQLNALYDAEIAENDAGFGQLLETIKSSGLWDSSVIVYVSDHGEEFYEHKRWGHGRAMVFEQLNVALVIRLPGQRQGARIPTPAQHADILPTLLELLGLPIPSLVEGRSLLDLMVTDPVPSARDETPAIFSHNQVGRQQSVVVGEYKLIQRLRRGKTVKKGLYNWRRDPRELDNLLADRPIHAKVLASLIARHDAQFQTVDGEEAELDEETLDELRALGYLN